MIIIIYNYLADDVPNDTQTVCSTRPSVLNSSRQKLVVEALFVCGLRVEVEAVVVAARRRRYYRVKNHQCDSGAAEPVVLYNGLLIAYYPRQMDYCELSGR